MVFDVEQQASYVVTHVALRVRDVDGMRQRLESSGASISEGPVELPGGKSLFVRDQDANVVELHEPRGA